MLLKDVMIRDVITLSENENMVQIIAKFRKYNFSTLPVIDEERKILGVVSSKDIMKVFLPLNPSLEQLLKSIHLHNIEEEDILKAEFPVDMGTTVKVSDIMNTHVITIEDHKTIADARVLMKIHNIERIPVKRNNTLVGFITLFDIIIAIFRERNVID
jgi:CBS domain-containing protein